MTYLFGNKQDFVARSLDSASRLRVSTPLTLFEHNNQYGTSPFKWDTSLAGTGALTENGLGGTVLSTGGTASGAGAIRASREYIHYQVGKSYYLGQSFNFGGGVANVSKRVGFYDQNNGVYLELLGTVLNLNVITNSTGSPVTTAIPQANWNVDRLDGTGPSGMTFVAAAANDFRIDFFGGFGIRFYVYHAGEFWIFHTIDNSSVTSPAVPGPATTNLPIRQEIVNLGVAATTATMTIYNANVMSEGATEQVPQYSFAAGSGIATRSITTRTPVFSIQASTTGPGRAIRNYGQMVPYTVDVYGDSPAYWELVANATLTGAAFSALSPVSLANIDVAATALTGGMTIFSGYITGTSATNRATVISDIVLNFPLVYSSLLLHQDTLSLVLTPLSGNVSAAGSIGWVEYY